MPPKSIEHFLDRKVADRYAIKNHHFFNVLLEVFGRREALFRHYTDQLAKAEQFRADLAGALAEDQDSQRKLAGRGALFLKPRINIMEFWSGLSGAFAAIFGLAITLFTILSSATKQHPPYEVLVALALMAIAFLAFKFAVDKRACWFKYVIANLEAIAEVGSNSAKYQNSDRG